MSKDVEVIKPFCNCYLLDDLESIISISDHGKPFNPLKKPDPDITLPAEKREIGGLGIFLVKKTMDNVTYSREDETNILTLCKYF